MTLTIELSPEEAALIGDEAATRGLEAGELAHRLVVDSLPVRPRGSLAELLQEWRDADATDDSEQVQQAREELEAFKRAMNANRCGEEPLYP